MSRTIPTVFIEEFESAVHHAYQGMGELRGRCRTKRGVVGNQVHFPVLGKTRAYPKVHRAPVVPANLRWTRPLCNLSDWHISDLTDVFEDIKTNVDERQNLGKSFSMAMDRQEDQFAIEALESIPAADQHDTAQGGQPWDPRVTAMGNIRPSRCIGAMVSALRNRGVSRQERLTGIMSALWEADFIADPSISSRDYGPDPNNSTRTGSVPVTHSVDLIFLDDRTETATDPSDLTGGFNTAGGIGYVFAESSIGLAYGKDPTLDIDWLPLYTSWLVTICMSMGSLAIDPDGVERLTGAPTAI